MRVFQTMAATGLLTIAAAAGAQSPAPATGGQPANRPMTLTTTAWADGAQIPARYTQAGEQVSPELKWSNVPAGTVTFLVHMLDPDVAIARGTESQVHWLMWNIPGTATGLPEGVKQGAELPDGSR